MNKIIDHIESRLDDAAAVGSADEARRVARVLSEMRRIALLRAEAIELRLRGRTEEAKRREWLSDDSIAALRRDTL